MTTAQTTDEGLQEVDALLDQAKKKIDANAPSTLIAIVLDESGSMGIVRDQTLDGLNQFIADQQCQFPQRRIVPAPAKRMRSSIRSTEPPTLAKKKIEQRYGRSAIGVAPGFENRQAVTQWAFDSPTYRK